MSSIDTSPPKCSHRGCSRPATIIHGGEPYCGEHALAKLEAGEFPDRLSDPPRTAVTELLPPSNRPASRSEELVLGSGDAQLNVRFAAA